MFADVDIWITHSRYYRTDNFSVGPHRGLIYSQAGAVLAQKTYASEATGIGWRTQAFDTPLHIVAGTPFCAALFSAAGDYAGTGTVFASQLDNAPLHGYQSSGAPGGGNGVFDTSGAAAFPTGSFNQTAYFADIVYETSAPNALPVANAGIDQTVASKTTVTLNGSASSDPDGTITGYTWRQLSGFAVTLSSTSVAQPTFTAPTVSSASLLTFGLVVTDNGSASSTENTVSINVQPPTAARYQLRSGVLEPVEDYRLTSGKLA
jgi:hypothetical protein